jgi:hypothetical protein
LWRSHWFYTEAKHETLKKTDWNRIQAAEMKYLRTAKGFTTAEMRIYEMSCGIVHLYERK